MLPNHHHPDVNICISTQGPTAQPGADSKVGPMQLVPIALWSCLSDLLQACSVTSSHNKSSNTVKSVPSARLMLAISLCVQLTGHLPTALPITVLTVMCCGKCGNLAPCCFLRALFLAACPCTSSTSSLCLLYHILPGYSDMARGRDSQSQAG